MGRQQKKIMGIFNRLFRKKPLSISRTLIGHNPDSLLKNATLLKSQGDIEGAIVNLRMAYDAIRKTSISYSVQTFLRLPQYLHIAGRKDEAWREFNNLIACGFPNEIRHKEIIPMNHSIIYGKMRLFLHREGRHDEAIKFGIYSYLSWTKGLFLQKRKTELREFIDKSNVKTVVDELLEKAKKIHLSEKIIVFVEEEIMCLPDVDVVRVGKKISNIIE